MNGYNDIHTEPSDDEEFATACGYEIISEEEMYEILSLSYRDSFHAANKRGLLMRIPFLSKRSSATAAATNSSKSPSSSSSRGPFMKKPKSSCSLSSQASEMSDSDFSCGASSSSGAPESLADDHHDHDDHGDEVDGHELSVENLWYLIQQKRHHHEMVEEEMRMEHYHHHHPHFLTLEHHASNNKLTEWFSNLLHFPEKLRQHVADKHRFNINKVPKELRDELKHIYVY